MKVFKFGGASINSAEAIRNVADILDNEAETNCLVVISAMGKMTNAFEKIIDAYITDNKDDLSKYIHYTTDFHEQIIKNLFSKNHQIHKKVASLYEKLTLFLTQNNTYNYDYVYDQIVCFGELLSSTIVSDFLNQVGITNSWKDARDLIITDTTFRDAAVHWKETEKRIKNKIDCSKITLVQGFIAGDLNGNTTTLGREGSDYTAGIFAYCLDAESLTIWKDVLGVLNADPREFKGTKLLEQISYEETIEMAFYGASVIHPKTIKPLQNKQIPLIVRSFKNLNSQGTKVTKEAEMYPYVPCYIVKKNQVLVSISSLDFSFIVEENISDIFKLFHKYQLKVNLIQNSAISFSVCIDNNLNHFDQFFNEIKEMYKVSFVKNVDLFTVRHFNENSLRKIHNMGTSLLSQINKNTAQIIIQKK